MILYIEIWYGGNKMCIRDRQIAQLFLVLLMGYAVVKTGLLKASDSKVLSVVFVYLVMPCVVLNAFQIKDTPEIRTGLLYSMGIAVGMHIVFLLLNALFRKALKLDAVEQVNIIYSNAHEKAATIYTFPPAQITKIIL